MKYKKIILFFSFLFLLLAFVLNRNVSKINSYQDIDSKAYIHYAKEIASGRLFTVGSKTAPYFNLGYAFFISIFYKLFGVNDYIVVWIQVFLSLFIFFLIFKITNILFGQRAALIAFIMSCISVGFLTFSQFILTEILLAFLLTVFLYFFVLYLQNKTNITLISSGLFLGLSIWIKPAAIYFVWPLLFIIMLTNKGFAKNFKMIFLFLISFYLPIFGYMTFNKIVFGNFQSAALGNENLYFYHFPKVLALKNKTNVDFELKKINGMLTGSKLDKESWSNIKYFFVKELKKNPFIFIKVWLLNVLKTLLGLFSTNLKVLLNSNLRGGEISFFKMNGTFLNQILSYITTGTNSCIVKVVGLYEAIWTILKYILCFISLLLLAYKKKWKLLLFLVFYIFYFSMITGHDGCARFRMMFEPVLMILAAGGISSILERIFFPSNLIKKSSQ